MRATVNVQLAQLRMAACRVWPYAAHPLLSMVPVETRGIGTMCVDRYWRLYYDPAFLESQPPDVLVTALLHEVSHCLLRHHVRGQDIADVFNDQELRQLWNWATDATINHQLREEGRTIPEGWITPERLKQPVGLSAEEYFRRLLDERKQQREEEERQRQKEQEQQQQQEAEEEDPQEQPEPPEQDDQEAEGDEPEADPDGTETEEDTAGDGQQPGDGESESDDAGEESQQSDGHGDQPGQGDKPGDGEDKDLPGDGEQPTDQPSDQPGEPGDGEGQGQPGDGESDAEFAGDQPLPGESGSCSDGVPRPWELPPPSEGTKDGEGEVPGLEPFEQDQIIKQALDKLCESQGSGAGMSEMIADALRPKIDPKRLLTKALRKHTDSIASGGDGRYSYRRPARRPGIGGMIRPRNFTPIPRIVVLIDTSGSMSNSDYQLCLGLVARCIEGLRLRDGVRVVTGDTRAAWAGKVVDHSKVQLVGGGGTDMTEIIRQLSEAKEKPDLIVCCTDGYTGWPEKSCGVPVVACITRNKDEVPSWIEVIRLEAAAAA